MSRDPSRGAKKDNILKIPDPYSIHIFTCYDDD